MKHYTYRSPFKMKDDKGNNYTLTVELDEYPENPRTMWDNVCTMVCWHRHYDLGDKHNYDGIEDFFQTLCDEVLNKKYGETIDLYWQDMYKMLKESGLIAIKAINLYDHSGITVSTSNNYPYNDPWDAGCVGFIYVTKNTIFKELGGITEDNWKERADEIIEAEMKIYDQYLRGEVYSCCLTKEVVVQEKCPHCGEVIREYSDTGIVQQLFRYYGDVLEENGIIDDLYGYSFC